MNAQDNIQAALNEFKKLPGGKTAYRIYGFEGYPDFKDQEEDSLFCASAFKVFVLAAYLHYAEKGELPGQQSQGSYPENLAAALNEELAVEPSDHTQGSPVFGNLTGKTTAKAILEAMIAYSDNTATDIAMKRVGVDNVRAFMRDVARLDEKSVRIPDSTKSFYNYLDQEPQSEHHLINTSQTMVCTASEFASFYSRAYWGLSFLQTDETRREFKRFLSTADAIPQAIPENMSCYMKGGSANWPPTGEHAMAAAGTTVLVQTIRDQTVRLGSPVSFALLYNWTGPNNWESGVSAYIEACKKVFNAIAEYVPPVE